MIEKIYYKSPRSIQNLLITAKSYSMRYKYAMPIDDMFDAEDIERGGKGREEYIVDRFNTYLSQTLETTPFYKKYLQKKNLSPQEVNLNNYKDILPIIDKSTIRQNYSDFINNGVKSDFALHTSGTTGSPLKILSNKLARGDNYKFFNSLLKKNKVNSFDKSVVIGGKRLFDEENPISFSRTDLYTKTLYLSNYHLNERNMASYLDEISRYNPYYIESYPFAIYLIACALVENNQTYEGDNLKVIITSSEALGSRERLTIEKAFRCKVVNQYGNVEMSTFAYSTSDKMYFPGLYSQVEFLKNSDDNYDIVSTGLINIPFPLLRYKTGDTLDKVYQNGITGAITSTVNGRDEDYIVLADGKKISQYNPVASFSNIKKSQIIQESPSKIVIIVQPSSSWSEHDRLRLLKEARLRLNAQVDIEIIIGDCFELTRSGKFKFILRRFD